jgi:hypothetical protein
MNGIVSSFRSVSRFAQSHSFKPFYLVEENMEKVLRILTQPAVQFWWVLMAEFLVGVVPITVPTAYKLSWKVLDWKSLP